MHSKECGAALATVENAVHAELETMAMAKNTSRNTIPSEIPNTSESQDFTDTT